MSLDLRIEVSTLLSLYLIYLWIVIYNLVNFHNVCNNDNNESINEDSDSELNESPSETSPSGPSTSVSEPPAKRAALTDLLGDVFSPSQAEVHLSLRAQVEDEVRRFKIEDSLTLDANPLDWWHLNQGRYPLLAKMAKVFLAIPATSVPSERVFSTGGEHYKCEEINDRPRECEHVNLLKAEHVCIIPSLEYIYSPRYILFSCLSWCLLNAHDVADLQVAVAFNMPFIMPFTF